MELKRRELEVDENGELIINDYFDLLELVQTEIEVNEMENIDISGLEFVKLALIKLLTK